MFYHILGSSFGALNIWMELPTGDKVLIIKPNDQQVDAWLHGRYTLLTFTPSRLLIEGVAGTSYTGDIALDDIYLHKGRCDDHVSLIMIKFL